MEEGLALVCLASEAEPVKVPRDQFKFLNSLSSLKVGEATPGSGSLPSKVFQLVWMTTSQGSFFQVQIDPAVL